MRGGDAGLWLAVVAAVHLGFQATVTVLVYPALVETTGTDWSAAHRRHSRRISPLVALLYGAWSVVAAWALATADRTPALVVSLAAGAVVLVVTAAAAAPTHGRLAREGRRAELLRRLLLADRVRLVAAGVAAVAALIAL